MHIKADPLGHGSTHHPALYTLNQPLTECAVFTEHINDMMFGSV
jgi:hypothetical protein